jgi:hypothetical protein
MKKIIMMALVAMVGCAHPHDANSPNNPPKEEKKDTCPTVTDRAVETVGNLSDWSKEKSADFVKWISSPENKERFSSTVATLKDDAKKAFDKMVQEYEDYKKSK